jgi:hypothetical protein
MKMLSGLKVPMDNAFVMRGTKTARNRQRIVERFALRQCRAGHALAKSFAFEQFRNDVGSAVVNSDVMDHENVRMIKCTCGLRFLVEAIKPIRVFRKGGRQDSDRDIATELRIW